MTTRVGINGLGRTGRAALRASLRGRSDIEVVAVNDLARPDQIVQLLVRDSVFGPLPEKIELADGQLLLDGRSVAVFGEADPRAVPWAAAGVDVVIESTGRFRSRDQAQGHIEAGASRVVISAPGKGVDATFVIGVNEHEFDPSRHRVVSNASCTTNCLAPMIKVLDEAFGLEQGFISTVHAYTGDQSLVDAPHKDARRSRAAGVNIIPTSTGAARTTGLVWPSAMDRLDGTALRVPVPDGSVTDLVAELRAPMTVGAVNEAFRLAAAGPLMGIIEYSEEPLVSTDIIGDPASCVFDSSLTMVGGHLVKVFGWYDNEWAYANRLVELCGIVGQN
jgi:glyceraldehyde 3-phosphate dehydrogenase